MRSLVIIAFLLTAAGCSANGDTGPQPRIATPEGGAGTSGQGGGSGATCVPGEQVSCGCPGGGTGAQVCLSDGSAFGPCEGCDGSGGSSGSGGTACPYTHDEMCAGSCGTTETLESCGGWVECGDCATPGVCTPLGDAGAHYCCTPMPVSQACVASLCGIHSAGCDQTVDCGPCPHGICRDTGQCACVQAYGWDDQCTAASLPPHAHYGECAGACPPLPNNTGMWCCP